MVIQDGNFGQSANWGSGVYENRYIKQNGVWKIQRLHLYLRFFAPYEGGWTHTSAALNARYGKSTAKPDRPPGSQYETWPVRQVAPMHYGKLNYAAYQLAPDDSVKAGEPAAGAARTAAGLEAQVRALELKLARLRAVDEVENLQSAYGYYADMSMQDATSALFTENSTLEILGRGVFHRPRPHLRIHAAPGRSHRRQAVHAYAAAAGNQCFSGWHACQRARPPVRNVRRQQCTGTAG